MYIRYFCSVRYTLQKTEPISCSAQVLLIFPFVASIGFSATVSRKTKQRQPNGSNTSNRQWYRVTVSGAIQRNNIEYNASNAKSAHLWNKNTHTHTYAHTPSHRHRIEEHFIARVYAHTRAPTHAAKPYEHAHSHSAVASNFCSYSFSLCPPVRRCCRRCHCCCCCWRYIRVHIHTLHRRCCCTAFLLPSSKCISIRMNEAISVVQMLVYMLSIAGCVHVCVLCVSVPYNKCLFRQCHCIHAQRLFAVTIKTTSFMGCQSLFYFPFSLFATFYTTKTIFSS